MENKKTVTSKKKKASKFSRVLKEIGNSLIESVTNLVNKFKKTKKEFKIILAIWIVVLIVFLIVMLISNSNKKIAVAHEKMENELKTATLKYVEENNLYATENQKLRINMEVLIQEGYLYKEVITDSTCVGYSLVYRDDSKNAFVIEPYMSCKSYVTEGYEVK